MMSGQEMTSAHGIQLYWDLLQDYSFMEVLPLSHKSYASFSINCSQMIFDVRDISLIKIEYQTYISILQRLFCTKHQ